MHTLRSALTLALAAFALTQALHAQVPQLVNYQGRVAVNGVNFPGPTGQFKFALVNSNGSVTYWGNSVDTNADGVPDTAVTLPVTNGLYSVLLGDNTSHANMLTIPANPPTVWPLSATVWMNADVRLRIWFNDGTNGFQLLSPDQRLAPSAYLSDLPRLFVYSPSTSSGENTATFAAFGIGLNQSHIHYGLTGDWYIRSANSGGKVILQDSGGNVGIGTGNPQHKLHVDGGAINAAGGLIIQVIQGDPTNPPPQTGQIWLRSDIP